jgi:hypothetical protein
MMRHCEVLRSNPKTTCDCHNASADPHRFGIASQNLAMTLLFLFYFGNRHITIR